MSARIKPLRGYFAALTSAGYIWSDTIHWRARDSRKACGKLFVGVKRQDGSIVDDAATGWAEAHRRGYRIIKVDVVPR